MSETYWQVAVDAPLPGALTYMADKNAELPLKRGLAVEVPLGKRKVSGVILKSGCTQPGIRMKSIAAIDTEKPVLPDNYLRWLEWLADYYLHPIGQVTSLAYPPLARSKRNRKSKKAPVIKPQEISVSPHLTLEQQTCVDKVNASCGFGVHLIHGVTGSGKTEIYLNCIQQVVERQQCALVLVPEISLTPQLVQRFSARFPEQVAVIHSHLTEREKTDQWWEMIDGKKKILIGARSALFCPVDNIGLIVIDEEHESSFKQDEKLKYHARDAAIVRAKLASCPILLGSATPSLESFYNAEAGRYVYHPLLQRVSERSLPTVKVIDLREEKEKRKLAPENYEHLPSWLSQDLYQALGQTFKKKDQAALFLNRRGVAQSVFCTSCGYSYECPNCAINLTLHGKNHLVCHYCDYSQTFTETCPQCQSLEVRPIGLGTELVEKELQTLFPHICIARADRDEIQNREQLESLITEMENGGIDLLIGTQMIAKGLDFPKLNLVGLILADVGFNLPDFRSSERSYQLLTQVSGRSGRHSEDPGQVIIQCFNTEHIAVEFTTSHDYVGFAHQELAQRKALRYPPFGKVASLRIQGMHLDRVEATAKTLASRAQILRSRNDNYNLVQVLGPAPAPLARLRGKHRYQILIKAPSTAILQQFNRQLLADLSWLPAATKVQIDVDPINML